jgi:lipopolysaccharide export system ATP-binding protein
VTRPVLAARGLRKRYGEREVLCGVDLRVEPGEVVGLLGPNGAGKTTTFNLIVGDAAQQGRASASAITEPDVPPRARHHLSAAGTVDLPAPSVADNQRDPRDRGGQTRDPASAARAAQELASGKDICAAPVGWRATPRRGGARARPRAEVRCLDEPFSGIDPIAVGDPEGDRTAARVGSGSSSRTTTARRSPSATVPTSSRTGRSCARALASIGRCTVREIYLGENFQLN